MLTLALSFALAAPRFQAEPQPAGAIAARDPQLAAQLDAWLDGRHDPAPGATAELLAALQSKHVDAAGLEALLRGGRASYPPAPERGVLLGPLPLPCEHVDHTTAYLLYVPKGYDPDKAAPLLVIGHGGSSGRDLAFGERAARIGVQPWLPLAEAHGAIVLAPLTDRGWGAIGNSILFSAIARAVRDLHVDPDRVYLTGHSMGGHLTWRSAMTFADRWAAVSPMSGGYDYVKDQQVYACINVPGYATWGSDEPYQINVFDRTIAAFMTAHGYPWRMVERDGGHEIFADELPKIWDYFAAHPRDLYRHYVFARVGGLEFAGAEQNPAWHQTHTWNPQRPLPCATVHWLRFHALPKDTPPDRTLQIARGIVTGNRIELTTSHVRKLSVLLHPRMVDFAQPVTIAVNGKVAFQGRVQPDLAVLLAEVRATGDRGRIYHAKVDLDIASDLDPGEPTWPRN